MNHFNHFNTFFLSNSFPFYLVLIISNNFSVVFTEKNSSATFYGYFCALFIRMTYSLFLLCSLFLLMYVLPCPYGWFLIHVVKLRPFTLKLSSRLNQLLWNEGKKFVDECSSEWMNRFVWCFGFEVVCVFTWAMVDSVVWEIVIV